LGGDRIVVLKYVLVVGRGERSALEKDIIKGDNPVHFILFTAGQYLFKSRVI
jgi:hypothetical protein